MSCLRIAALLSVVIVVIHTTFLTKAVGFIVVGKQSKFLHNMRKCFEGSSSHLFYETFKLIGFLLSSLEFEQSHSFGHCLINSFDKFFEMFYHPVLES
jgi:hypothetical protein